MRKLTSLIAFTVALIGSIAVQAQVYPVQGNGVLIPPYSVYLADYTEGTSDRIVLNVVLNDVSRPDLRVRLRAKIIGQSVTLETKPEYIGRELVLEGGIPLRLTGIDLAEYFDPVNLNFSGISRREFEKTGALPQGLYQFCFEVLEYNRGVKISNTICANGWLILNDPPIINLPRNGEKLVPTQPQNIVFQWTPRHTGSPNSAFTTEYDVKLVELWPANRNPNDAILTSPPILEETTRSTAFIYDVSQTPLELGRHYALQIKAKSIAGADELDLFKNNGKSEVATFIYGDPCTVPQNILLEATSATRFTARWAGDFNHTGYSLRYRLADNPSAPWYTNTTLVPDAAISGLQPNTTYEVQIAGGCGVFESLYSGTARIKTFDTSEQGYSCGMPLEQFNLDPVNLLDVLKVGDVIQAGDFDVKIAKVSGSNGTFTGEGVIEVPFFNKARVKAEFASIVVNKDMRMVNGYLNVTGAGVDIVPSGVLNMMDELIGAADSALTNLENNRQQPFDPNAFVPDTTLTLPGPVTVTDDNGTVVITDANGVQHRLPPGTEAAIVDDQGNGTLIDSKGKAHAVSGAVATAAANREYNLALKFTEAKNNPTYGFDALDEPDAEVFKILANRYTKLEDDYYVPYKSVETGHTTTVTGVLEGSGIDKSKIQFQLGGVTLPSTPFSGNESTVTVSGKADGEEEWLIAVLPAENEIGKEQVLGRVNVVSYNKINKNVVIIPVNGNTFSESDGTALQAELNKIYNQEVVSWSVSVRSGIQVAGIDPFDVGATGMLTNYTRHMKDVINAYKDNMKDGDDTYYLFLVKNPSDPKIAGFMPRSKRAGFIFTDKTPGLQAMARTVAHELGHGVFNLHHTFMEENFSLPESETDNLMDYAGGTKLYKYQWDMMRYPPVVMGLFEEDAEAESVTAEKAGTIIGYVIADEKAYVRENQDPYKIKEPKVILDKGKEVEIVSVLVADKTVSIKYLTETTEHTTSLSNLKKIIKLDKTEKYLVLSDIESFVLPYSDTKSGNVSKKDTYVIADKFCGEYCQVKEATTNNQGWWLPVKSLKRVGNDVAGNFNWMQTVTIGDGAVPQDVLDKIKANINGVNDKTDRDIYGSNRLRKPDGKNGYMYVGNDSGSPVFPGTTAFEKEVQKEIYDEIAKEGSYGSINTWDKEVFTWGKGFSVKGELMDVLEKLISTTGKNYSQIFLNVGIKVVNGSLWVLDTSGNWRKDENGSYKASEYIKGSTQLLSFFAELAEKKDYKQDIINAQYGVFSENAGNYPSYIMNTEKTAYEKNWSHTSVTVLAHLSHWCGYSWSKGIDRYKDTNGDLDKILYTYIYKTVTTNSTIEHGTLETSIYKWNPSYSVLKKFEEFGNPKSAGLDKFNETWSAHTITIEFKVDKNSKNRALKKDTNTYVSNSECVLIYSDGSYVVVTKNADAITYENFEE